MSFFEKTTTMNTKLFIVVLLLSPVLAFAQYNFKPIIDTTVFCVDSTETTFDRMPNPYYNYGKKEAKVNLFHITENMPGPELSTNKIQEVLKNNIRFNKEEKKINGEMFIQCVVNCEGNAGDYQIMHCPDGFSEICNKVISVFRSEVKNWYPGKQNGNFVNVQVRIQVKIDNGDFEVIAPFL